MSTNELEVRNGPDKADLLRAMANPQQHLQVSFDTEVDPVEAHINAIEEIGGDGLTFGLRGHLTSGNLRGAMFAGTYNSGTRKGRIILKRA
jgi:hypothetical protein